MQNSNDGVGELATPIKRQFVSFHKMEPAGTFENASETTSVVSSPLTLDSLEVDYPDKLVIDDVRITPSYMIFENAYEGKHYRQNMVIQNCGKHLAFIRLGEPNSRTFEFRSFDQGLYLSPGMKIVRNVNYTYRSALGVLRGFAPIYVNKNETIYYFIVTLSTAVLSLEPQELDFGRIDAVNHATTRTFYIKNSGYKGTQFAIDLGRNPLEMIVQPMKGQVPAKTRVPVTVEIVGAEEGSFMEEIWVKTQPPQRVVVSGVFISPKLLVRKFINSLDFTLIDFESTYYGSNSTQPLLLKNFSSSHSMFCVMADIQGKTMTLEDARKIDDNYMNFIIKPIDGRMAALKGAIIQITFAPVKTRQREKNYAACFLKVIRMDCRDVGKGDFEATPNAACQMAGERLTAGSPSRDNFLMADENGGSYESLLYTDEAGPDHFSFEHAIGVCLHGEKEQASVILRPDIFTLSELTLTKNYTRELLVGNESFTLPIRVKYNKVPCIDIFPPEFSLAPEEQKEILVVVRTFKLGKIVKKICFDLLSFDTPNDYHVIRKVGSASLKFEFEVTDVVQNKRLGQCLLCQDLPEKLTPEFPYRLDPLEVEKKLKHNEYYLAYIRTLKKIETARVDELQDYDLTNPNLLLRRTAGCQNPSRALKDEVSLTPFIPLAPLLLHNIKITPKSIKLRKVAAYTSITESFQIENLNSFPIRVRLQASKSCIVFDNDSRHVINSNENKKIPFVFSTCSIGRYYVNINVLINDSTLYEVTAVARVVPKTLKLETSTIEFTESDGHYKFFNLINGLNAYTSFDWDVPPGCFKIYPLEGGIKSECFIICMVTYTPDPSQPNVTECVLTSESGQKRVVQVSYKKRNHAVVFDDYDIDVGVIPLNVPVRRKITLKNLKNFKVIYNIPNGIPVPGITIQPRQGVLDGLDSQVFIITIYINAVVEFSTHIVFMIDEDEQIEIGLKGVVDYPTFSIKPDILYFRKISPYSFDTLAFKIKNISKCESYITFPEDFPEFTITESEDNHYPHHGKCVLRPEQSKILFLHFHPNYVSTYSLYLPYRINDILGPIFINSSQSLTPNFFLQDNTIIYEHAEGVTVAKKVPRMMPIVRLNCCAIDKILEFSGLNINFVYFGEGHYNNSTSQDFEITNTSAETASVCIRIDDLESPFSLYPKDEDVDVEFYDVSYKIVLEGGEKIVFQADFLPMDMGIYTVKLPIFLRHYYNDKIFNYLTLSGTYKTPTITPSTERVDFEPVPLRVSNEIHLTLHMENHFEECEVVNDCDLNGLFPIFEKGRHPETGDSLLAVTLTYESLRSHGFNTKLIFHCTCGSRCEVTVTGVTENCLLTTHAFSHNLVTGIGLNEEVLSRLSGAGDDRSTTSLVRQRFFDLLLNTNTTCYPLFPSKEDDSDYAEYMRSLQKTLENWVFTQGFYMKSYHRIPEGFSDFCKAGEARKKMRFGGHKKPKTAELPILQLMLNIAGRKMRDQLVGKVPTTENELDWLIYICKANSNILRYLREFTVYLPHVTAKLLLNYDQYILYEKIKRPKSTPLDEETFNQLSTQCWMDLIIQIIKTFFLFRTVPVAPTEEARETSLTRIRHRQSFSAMSRLSTEDEGEHIMDLGVYGDHEKELIAWLQMCYDEEKVALWEDSPKPDDKELTYLDIDLRDGLIFGAATAHYCPYVKQAIKDMYTTPQNAEELLHNACTLVKVWKELKFSYEISPLVFEKCSMIEMLLLATYLYDILPSCLPKEEVTIQAPLTQTGSVTIELENLGQYPIYYQVVFFGNQNELFSVASNTVKVEPEGKKTVKVRYHAKCVLTTITNLLFSGETPEHRYGRSLALTLVGVADVSYACMEIPLAVDLYKPCEVVFNTESPFKMQADYNLYFGYQPVSKEQNVLFPWEEVKRIKTIKEFIFHDDLCHFDEEGKSTTKVTVCCLQTGPRNMWFYFTNPEVGDWGVQVTLKGKVTEENFEYVEVVIPENYENLVCRCKRKPSVTKNCPLIINAQIPMKNNLLWDARKAMVLHYVQGAELKFWSKRIFTPTGTRILTLILNSETHPMKETIVETVKYKVVLETPSPFVTLKTVTFDDITSEDFYDLPIHPVKDLLQVGKCILRLVSEDETEKRFYKLCFKSAETSPDGGSSNVTVPV